jgi:predicted MPP superfamily phosphohydrolase
MKNTNFKKSFLWIVLGILISLIVYTVYDNNRFRIVEQEITINQLPESFDGFKILQISDLHGKYFGRNQVHLVTAINALEYNMIALTGDMNKSTTHDNSIESSQAILDLLDGIENKDNMFWVDGNVGPYAIENFSGANTGELTEIGTLLQSKGCKMVILPQSITRGADRIWITPYLSEMLFDSSYRMIEESWVGGAENFAKIQSFYSEVYESFGAIKDNDEVKIMLDHYPMQINMSTVELAPLGNLDFDLILAGHYHGGQLRLPFLGAIYIPSPTAGLNGFFPPQNAAKGLSTYGDTPQYVSAGLGSSGHVALMNFRLFNTPEINIITLRRP